MQNKATVIACVNQKGGTGKTCTAENLGIGMVQEGKKVLLVDMDPQASLTISLGYPRPDDLPVTVSDQMAKVKSVLAQLKTYKAEAEATPEIPHPKKGQER